MSMACPQCGGPTATPRTNDVEEGRVVVRLRSCTSKGCRFTFTTRETACLGPQSCAGEDAPVSRQKGRSRF